MELAEEARESGVIDADNVVESSISVLRTSSLVVDCYWSFSSLNANALFA